MIRDDDSDEFRAELKRFEAKHGKVQRKRTTSPKAKKPDLSAEEAFLTAWQDQPLAGAVMVREYTFHPTRKWRFDFAWPAAMVALEVEGWGRHQTFEGYRKDCEKYNAALLMGWRVLRFMAADKRLAPEWVRLAKLALCGITEPEMAE